MSVQIRQSAEEQFEEPEEQYDKSLPGVWGIPGRNPAFLRALIREFDSINTSRAETGRVLDFLESSDDCEYGALVIFPSETRVFVGGDPTAKTHADFGFAVRPSDPIPTPQTAQEALDLLKPTGVRQAMEIEGEIPTRQGEWWLLETDEEPASSVFKPGVNKRPFGGSPLDNHVPREYGLGVSDDVFMGRVQENAPELFEIVESVGDVFDKAAQAHRIASIEDVELQTPVPELDVLRDWCEEVYVRGTLRHRENDHYLERIGESWHTARTHNMDVYTIDGVGTAAEVQYD